ncbi:MULTISPECIES: ABC transporter permease subunit [Idiomarina]|uniref:Peptide ABC transporter permease n=1 Tax=Idiomarina piscisalsi TaxID=1096243 RepID=A0A432YW46_9GAMM|nr:MULTISPECIES: ABC transporter permease subunit [Idiomarina]RUO67532.1 peptide ABC transporter permease [Idiomarina piscisalsi]
MPHINLYYKDENPSPLTLVWRRFKERLLSMTALYILLAMILVVIFSPILAPYSTSMQFADAVSLPPSWTEQGNIQFLMGTDDLGRDMLSRLLIGSIYSLGLPILMVAVSSIIGMVIGAVLGIDRTIKYQTFSRVFDTLLSIPSFLMALIIIAILGTGLFNVALAITLSLIPQFIFVTRNAVHQEWHKDYVTASRLNGCSKPYLLYRVILPNITPILVMQLTVSLSVAIMDIAALSFLGLGIQSPTPEWGSMLARSLDEVYLSPWSMVLPGVTLFVTIMSINIVGDSLRRALSERVNS